MQPVKIIIKHKGDLTKYGYSAKIKAKDRRVALLKAVIEKRDFTGIIKKLNALTILQKNTSPKNSKIFHSDMKFLQAFRDKLKNKK